MMEHIGTITAAGQELSADKTKKVFKLHLDNPKYTYTLFHKHQKDFAEENIGKTVKVFYTMTEDEKYRNVESLELATAEAVVALSGRDDAIAAQVAAKIVKDLWIMGTIKDTDHLIKALRAWCGKLLGSVPAKDEAKEIPPTSKEDLFPPTDEKPTKAPPYKDKEGDDVSRATDIQKEALKRMLGTPDDDEFTNAIRTRFGDEVLQIKDLSKNEAGEWITELQKEV